MKPRNQKFFRPTYAEDKNKAKEFLTGYKDSSIIDTDDRHGNNKYMI